MSPAPANQGVVITFDAAKVPPGRAQARAIAKAIEAVLEFTVQPAELRAGTVPRRLPVLYNDRIPNPPRPTPKRRPPEEPWRRHLRDDEERRIVDGEEPGR